MNIQTPLPLTSNELAVMTVLTPAVVFAPGGVDEVIGKIKAEVQTIVADISTEAGRKAIASTAYKIARSKTALDKMGKDLGENHHKAWKAITTERARIATELDALKDEFRKPLTDWENAEKNRVAAHEAALAAIVEAPGYGQAETAAELRARMDLLLEYPERDWQEFSDRALATLESEIDRTRKLLAAAVTREAERAELERLRREQIEREQRERDERIAREAAERARAEAERQAQVEAVRVAALAEQERQRIERSAAVAAEEARQAAERAEAERTRAEREKHEAEERARQAEANRVASEERARQQAEEAARQAEAARVAAAEQAERERVAAVEAERQRVAAEQAAAAAETVKREADRAHRAAINTTARDALVAAGLTPEQATVAITTIAKGAVPNVKISY